MNYVRAAHIVVSQGLAATEDEGILQSLNNDILGIQRMSHDDLDEAWRDPKNRLVTGLQR